MPIVVTPTLYESDDYIDSITPKSVDNIEIYKEQTFMVFGKELDLKSLYIYTLGMIITVIIWNSLGLFALMANNHFIIYLFVGLMVSFIFQVYTSSLFAGSLALEQSKLTTVQQINSALVGSIIIYLIFINYHYVIDQKLQLVGMVILVNSLLSSMYIVVKMSGNSLRTLRKVKQTLVNINLVLFSTLVYLSIGRGMRRQQ